MPEPPNIDSPDMSRIEFDFDASSISPMLRLSGNPGAVEPGAIIWVVSMDSALPAVEEPVASDGSFEVLISGTAGSYFRLQARDGERRSAPVDVFALPEVAPTVVEHQACLGFPGAGRRELGFGSVTVGELAAVRLEVRNDCSDEVRLASGWLRLDSEHFAHDAIFPQALPPGSSAGIELGFQPQAPGLLEGLLVLEVEGPFEELRAFTLFGEGL